MRSTPPRAGLRSVSASPGKATSAGPSSSAARTRDTAWFAMIDEEWPALKAAYERWLAPGNFDAKGRQKTRLSELTAAALAG